jgi:ABC-type polysaccharide/polyol phosphate transport system ATPase subunit
MMALSGLLDMAWMTEVVGETSRIFILHNSEFQSIHGDMQLAETPVECRKESLQDQKEIEYTISLRNVTKRFVRRNQMGGYSTVKSLFLSLFQKKKDLPALPQTVALDELTMRVPKGSSVGVIGRNGSGKSTLLKLITGIYLPDSGTVECGGRISALIELGAGFHPDFTGRENIYLGGMIQGLTRKEIDERFDEIVAFAELEDFVEQPVRTYSSGMFMRLGFSLAIHSDPEVLLVDEVLAVGDEGFVSKCKGRISALRERGVTLMLVTHDLASVERWCDEVIWLDSGAVMDRGEPRRVIDAYRQFIEGLEEVQLEKKNQQREREQSELSQVSNEIDRTEPQRVGKQEILERWGSREVEILGVRLLSEDREERFVFHPNDPCVVEIDIARREEGVDSLVFGVAIHHMDGTLLFGTNTDIERVTLAVPEGGTTLSCRIPQVALLAGEYWLDVAVHREDGYPYDYWKRCVAFSVRSSEGQVGRVYLNTEWERGE